MTKLDSRIVDEILGMASLPNLERCRKCNFAMEMEVSPELLRVFTCLKCGAETSRLCHREWEDDHVGLTCKEFEAKMSLARKNREKEARMNEAVIRKCTRCTMSFMKEAGCNLMRCRCGLTQCYICRKENVTYDHLCRHLRDPAHPNRACKHCTNKCLLFEDPNKYDDELIANIRDEADQPTTSGQQRGDCIIM